MKMNFCLSAAAAVLTLFVSGCRTQDEKLAAYFTPELFWKGKNTAVQYMTDQLHDPRIREQLQDLSGSDIDRKDAARKNLARLRDLIEFGKYWELPAVELAPGAAKTPPVLDGDIKRTEWKGSVEIPGSCRAGRRRRNYDGSRFLLMYDRENLYLAAYFPWNSADPAKNKLTADDHILLYFDTGFWEYREYAYSPQAKNKLLCSSWAYCGNGSRVKTGTPAADIKIVSGADQHGYSIEAAIPLKILYKDRESFIRLGLLRWDKNIEDYRTPIALPYHGHDIFNRVRVRPLPGSVAVSR